MSNHTVSLIVIFIIIVFIATGTIIEGSQIGNRRDLIVIADDEKVNALNYKDVNRKLLLEKEPWTFNFLAFSFIRSVTTSIFCAKNEKGLN